MKLKFTDSQSVTGTPWVFPALPPLERVCFSARERWGLKNSLWLLSARRETAR